MHSNFFFPIMAQDNFIHKKPKQQLASSEGHHIINGFFPSAYFNSLLQDVDVCLQDLYEHLCKQHNVIKKSINEGAESDQV